MTRQTNLAALAALTLFSLVSFLGCEPGSELAGNVGQSNANSSNEPILPGQLVSARTPTVRTRGLPVRSPNSILIASFNIQTFGESKMKDKWVIERIAHVIQQFDIVAVQEVRAVDQTLLPRLLEIINSKGARYDFLLGPRLGRTVSKEQYAYIYDTNTVVTSVDASYTIQDQADLLHREPLVARFVTRVPPNIRPFSFSLVNIHTDPDEVKTELPVMHQVLKGIREFEYLSAQEDDVILMGDLNANPKQFGNLGQIPGIYWIIDSEFTNTIRKSIWDNMIFDRGLTNEYTGRSGVLDLCEMFGIKTEDALRISDHLPIWAEFVVTEQMPGALSQMVESPGQTRR
jgi:endonuclease/exonuclease/phosphatase family metal-dependent hydrolase